jgi:hypothetical protein
MVGVEIARSDPSRWYLSMILNASSQPTIETSTTAGRSFTESRPDLTVLGDTPLLLIAAVDPDDAQTIYFRATGMTKDALAISTDGGRSVTVPLRLTTHMSSFLRRTNGTLLVAQEAPAGATVGGGFQSPDGGRTFMPWNASIVARGLAERGGMLFAANDVRDNGWAAGVSTDNGASWTPILRFEDPHTPKADCTRLARICPGSSRPSDGGLAEGGLDAAGGAVDAAPRKDAASSGGEQKSGGGGAGSSQSGCGCSASFRHHDACTRSALVGIVLALADVLRRHAKRRRIASTV